MKYLLFIVFLSACSGHREEPSDDYVLIEFASKLEEDYQRFNSNPDTDQKKN